METVITADTKPATPSGECKLLSIPQEIRLEIYRYLLLPSEFVSIAPEDHRSYNGDESDEWTDEESIAYDSDNMDMQIDPDMPGYGDMLQSLVGQSAMGSEESENDSEDTFDSEDNDVSMRGGVDCPWDSDSNTTDPKTYSMHPNVLLLNKQIYAEASSLLFNEGTVVIDAYDLFCLSDIRTQRFGAIDGCPWRHNPLEDPGTKMANGTVIYTTPQYSTGLMEPHIFAKFKKVLFDANFDEDVMQDLLFRLNIESGLLDSGDVKKFQKRLETSTVMKDFVKLLQNSPVVNRLTINLLVEVTQESELDEMDLDSDDEEAEEELDNKLDAADLKANERATEAFMDSDVFLPLKDLKNVKDFQFRFGFDDYLPPTNYDPTPRHAKMIKVMKETIEGNFVDLEAVRS